MKDDITSRVSLLYKHIYEAMNVKELNVLSNRSGGSNKSSRAKKSTSHSSKSKKRRSSQKKRSRRYVNDHSTPGSINNSFVKVNIGDSKNSLPSLSAIYGNSFDSNNKMGRRNNSGLAGIDLSSHKRRKGHNSHKVNHTLDAKLYDKKNSLSMVVPSNIVNELRNSSGAKKSPGYVQRNMSIGTNKTYDDRKSGEFSIINPLDFDTRMNLINKSNMAQYEGLRNHRYKLNSLINKNRRSGSRKKNSNSKKRAQRKISHHYRNRFAISKDFKSKHNERKKTIQAKPTAGRQLINVNSAKEYIDPNDAFMLINKLNSEGSFEHKYGDHQTKLESDEQETLLAGNPEDCKDTIFSGEGEIIASAGETDPHPTASPKNHSNNLNNDELVAQLTKENNLLKSQMKKVIQMNKDAQIFSQKMVSAFQKFSHNHNISLSKDQIQLPK